MLSTAKKIAAAISGTVAADDGALDDQVVVVAVGEDGPAAAAALRVRLRRVGPDPDGLDRSTAVERSRVCASDDLPRRTSHARVAVRVSAAGRLCAAEAPVGCVVLGLASAMLSLRLC